MFDHSKQSWSSNGLGRATLFSGIFSVSSSLRFPTRPCSRRCSLALSCKRLSSLVNVPSECLGVLGGAGSTKELESSSSSSSSSGGVGSRGSLQLLCPCQQRSLTQREDGGPRVRRLMLRLRGDQEEAAGCG